MLHVLEPFGMVSKIGGGAQMTIDWIPPMINCTFLDTPLICNPDFLAINVLHKFNFLGFHSQVFSSTLFS